MLWRLPWLWLPPWCLLCSRRWRTPTPQPTASPTAVPTAAATQSPTPAPGAETSEDGEGLPVWLWIVLGTGLLAVLLGMYVYVRRRR